MPSAPPPPPLPPLPLLPSCAHEHVHVHNCTQLFTFTCSFTRGPFPQKREDFWPALTPPDPPIPTEIPYITYKGILFHTPCAPLRGRWMTGSALKFTEGSWTLRVGRKLLNWRGSVRERGHPITPGNRLVDDGKRSEML